MVAPWIAANLSQHYFVRLSVVRSDLVLFVLSDLLLLFVLLFAASPVANGGKLYFTVEEGAVQIMEAAKEFKLVATRSLGAQSMATPAIQDGALFFRTRKGPVCVAYESDKK